MKILLLLALICVSGTAFAQSGNRFVITRGVVAGGGTTFSSSARFQLGSTIAQPLAADTTTNLEFVIRGGFWIWPSPTFFAPAKTGDDFIVSFQTNPGNTYTVQYTDSLSPVNWQSLPNVAGSGAVESVTNHAPGIAQRFYRLIEQ